MINSTLKLLNDERFFLEKFDCSPGKSDDLKVAKRIFAMMQSLFDGLDRLLTIFIHSCYDIESFSIFEMILITENVKSSLDSASKWSFEHNLVEKIQDQLSSLGVQFIDGQLKAIEEQRLMLLSSKKKIDLFSFTKSLPVF